ncbi:putative ribonuclease H-like domain-containing protein [Tanacetum coccineum]|uniref:Ribonuclease H-like domain-containing protein n=1 Tax=Tanacetum coccineum TaxID=301880 RepID=A0ABQ5GVJ3_9ASTR
MYSFNLENLVPSGGLACLIAKATIDESNKWHRRLGHVNFKNLNKLVKGNLVRGLPSKIFQNDHTCVACQKGKQHKASCKAKSVSSISQPLQLLHMDLFGPTSVRSLNHKTYCLVITDDFSRFSWVFFLRTKDETSGILKDFIRQIENQLNQKVKTIRCDNGTEFKNRDFIEFCGSKGIKREYSNARTPQQNRVAERKNRTLIEAARTMLADSFLPNTFWAEAVSTACYVLNRVLVTKPQNKTPYELITGKIPIISYIRPFGCHVTILNTIDHLGKFDGKSDEGFLVGYSLQSKAFRVYNLETKRVEENLHIAFLENKPNVAGKGPTWLFDLDYLTDSMNYQPVRSENQANKHAGPKEANHSVGTKANIDARNSKIEDESAKDYFVLPIWSSYTSTVKSSKAKNVGEEPSKNPDLKTDEKPVDKEGQVFLDNLERLKRQEQDANDAAEALRKEFAKDTEDLLRQAGAAKASSTNTVNIASTPVSTASPNGGLSFTDLTNTDQGDSKIPALEEIYDNPTDGIFTNASYDDEGAVADFTNLETIVNVSPIPTSRINSIHPSTLILEDPKSVIQKVWILVDLPYEKKAIGTKWVYKNKKDERGVVVRNKARIEAIRIFLAFASYMGFIVYQMDVKSAFLYGKINEEVYVSQPPGFIDPKYPKKSGYRKGTIDKTLFMKKDKNDIIFQMSSMGDLTFFLGLQVKQKENGIFISQDKYVAEILKKFNFASVKTASTPIETQNPLVKDEEDSDVDVHLYRSMIGSLMYLTASRPDIMFAVYACSRFQVTPKTSHLNAMKRIFRCLKGKPKLGLWYPRVSSFDLEAYSDSDYAGANLDRKFITGGCQFLGRRLISWQCKKQTIVAISTIEAEYVVAANCCGQVLWIQNKMLDYGFNFINTKIYIDNESTICIVKNPIFYSKTKHIAIRHHFIRDAYEKKLIQVLKIHTDDNVADLLTKAFNVSRYITAKVAGKHVSILEASIRSDLIFDDANGIDSLPNQAIFDAIQLMGYEGDLIVLTFNKALFSPQWKFLFHTMNHCISSKRTSWDQIPTNIATAVICLTNNQKYNFSKLIFDGMMRHLDAKKKFVMYPRFISVFLDKQLKNVPVPLDHFPINALTSKVFSFMVKKGKHFLGNVTPLFDSMLVQPTEDEGDTLERQSKPQPIISPPHPSTDQHETQTNPSPRPSPTTHITDSIPEGSGGNHRGQSSSDRSLSENEGGMTLQSVYNLYISLCIQSLNEECIHEAKIGRKEILEETVDAKGACIQTREEICETEPTVHKDPAFDELDDDAIDYMETEDAQDMGRTRYVVHEEKESAEKEVSTEDALSTAQPKVSTDKPKVSTERPDEGTDKQKVSTDKEEVSTDCNNRDLSSYVCQNLQFCWSQTSHTNPSDKIQKPILRKALIS